MKEVRNTVKKFFYLFFSFFFLSNLYSNENIKKANNLYLQGIINSEIYFKTLNEIGIDTSNEIFKNLYELFSSNILGQQDYERSLVNILNSSTKTNGNTENIFLSNDLENLNYIIVNCKGRSDLCEEFENTEVNLYRAEDIIKISDQVKTDILKRTFIISVIRENYKKNDNKFEIRLTLQHMQGVLIDFVISGEIHKEIHKARNLRMIANGSDLFMSDLENI